MRAIIVFIQHACILLAHTQRPTANGANDRPDAMERLVRRMLQASSHHRADLDTATFGKPGHQTTLSRTSSLLAPSSSMHVRSAPGWPRGNYRRPWLTQGPLVSPLLPKGKPPPSLAVIARQRRMGNNREQYFDLLDQGQLMTRFLQDEIIFLVDVLVPYTADIIIAQLLYLQGEGKTNSITLYISSQGGYFASALAIYDTMEYIRPQVGTVCIAEATGAAALVLAAGEKGKRCCLPHSRIIVRQPAGQIQGQGSDIQNYAKEILDERDVVEEAFAEVCGKTKEEMKELMSSRKDKTYLIPEDAIKYGLIDEIIEKAQDAGKKLDAAGATAGAEMDAMAGWG